MIVRVIAEPQRMTMSEKYKLVEEMMDHQLNINMIN